MRVRIISYEDVNGWILGKFALKMQEELTKLGVSCDIDNVPDPTADINHHIIYLDYDHESPSKADSLMITHIDNLDKLNLLKAQLQVARLGVCMSRETMNSLLQAGVPKERLCFINPAHDNVIKPRPLKVGLTCKVQDDGRKREALLVEISQEISPDDFCFEIMGSGWDTVVAKLRQNGFQVSYTPEFIYDKYVQLIPTLDYYLYMGQDEGQMGFVDAASAGVKTIVTAQGYHLDALEGLGLPFNSPKELKKIFKTIAAERRAVVNSVADWTWDNYALKHLDVWRHLLGDKDVKSSFRDGLNSLLEDTATSNSYLGKVKAKLKILNITISRFYHSKDKKNKILRKISVK
jgi:hypothetical protein